MAAIYPSRPVEDCDCRAIRDHRILFILKFVKSIYFNLASHKDTSEQHADKKNFSNIELGYREVNLTFAFYGEFEKRKKKRKPMNIAFCHLLLPIQFV